MTNAIEKVSYRSLSGIDVNLDAETVINHLTRGNGKITPQECAFFLRTCEAKKLDPMENGEVYLVKFGDQPAQMVIGYHAYMRRAEANPEYLGFKAGVVVAKNNEIVKKEGSAVYQQIGETLLGGWCTVFRKKGENIVENYSEVPLSEYSTGKSSWSTKPATMIRKVAINQAHRDAFPNDYEGLYGEEELTASGAIPCGAKDAVNASTETVDAKPKATDKITKHDGNVIVREAKKVFGDEANTVLKQIVCEKFGYKSMSDIQYKDMDAIITAIHESKVETVEAEFKDVSEEA